jgi:ABC-type sugar transport system ATPase subunit
MNKVIFEVQNLSKSFGSVDALSNVNLTFYKGEIHAILGQNGAGKSTLVKLLTGVHQTSTASGTLLLKNQPISLKSVADALEQGIGYVPQEIELVDNLTVAENIFAGRLPTHRGIFTYADMNRRAQDLLEKYDLNLPFTAFAATLGAAQRQMVMIARALAFEPSILLWDEPTTSLSTEDAQALSRTLISLRKRGVTMIYITHRIPEVMTLCDRATVMRDGKVAITLPKEEMNPEKIITSMVGAYAAPISSAVTDFGERKVVLQAQNLSAPALGPQSIAVHDVDFDLREGEILGIGGLVGSGRSELLKALAGIIPSTGTLTIDGANISRRTPNIMRRLGVHLMTEDRKREGLLFNLNLIQNVTAGSLSMFSKMGIVNNAREEEIAIDLMHSLSVKTISYLADPHQLSGGNQQKLLLARILVESPQILLLDEPTKGVDVGARQEIYRIIRHLQDSGKSIIVVSSDLEELLMISERIIVLSMGKKVDEFIKNDGSEARILQASTGIQLV